MKRILFFIIVFFILFFSCFRKPKWQTNITIPLLSKIYSIQNFIDTSLFKINNDSSIHFNITGNLDTIRLLDSLKFNDRTDSLLTKLSDFNFSTLASATVKITADEVIGIPLPETLVNIVIPPFHQTVQKNLRFSNIGTVLINYCVMKITVFNNSSLMFDTINCRISKYDIIQLTEIDSFSTTEYTRHFSNVPLESLESFDIYFASQGSNGYVIPLSKYDSIRFQVKFDSLKIDTACFRSNPPRIVRTNKTKIYSIPTNYQFRINDLVFNSGQISLVIENNFPLSINLQCSIPEISYDTILSMNSFGINDFNIDLSQRNYHNTSDSFTPITFKAFVEFQLDSNYVCFGPQNFIKVSYAINNIHIESIAGTILDTIKRSFQKDSIAISLPDFLQNVTASNVVGTINITNAISFPMHLTLCALASSSTITKTVDTFFSLSAGTSNNPSLSTHTINLTDLFNIHPTHISFTIEAASIGTGWMNRSSYATASYVLFFPLRIVFQSDTITFNSSPIKISEKTSSIIRDYGDSSVCFVKLQNHMPMRLCGNIILQNFNYDSVCLNIAIPSGIIDLNSGQVISASESTLAIVLNPSATEIFTDSTINVSATLFIPQTDTITISARDYFRIVNSYAQVHTKPVLKEKNNQ